MSEIARGRTEALAEVYDEHSRVVFETARCIVGQRPLAEEVVQDVFLRLWDTPERFDGTRGTLRGYLKTVAYGRAIDLARSEISRRRREEKEARLAGRGASGGAGPLDTHVVVTEELRGALAQLKEPEREAIAMAYFLGYSYRDVATELGVPEGTIKNRIRKGLARLRDELDAADVGDVSGEEVAAP